MTASLLDGKQLAATLRQQLQYETQHRIQQGLRPPSLAVILLGNDPASNIYVTHKRRACLEVGFESHAYDLPAQTHQSELLALIAQLNTNPAIDGILVQLPLPPHINTATVIEHIAPHKDVDGFHPYNLGRLAQGNPLLRPCTPYGIIQLLQHYALPLHGLHAVVIGTSTIVGRPMALELLLQKATVTQCHRATRNLETHVRMADVLIVATGTPDVVSPKWLNQDQIVIDVGIHRRKDGTLRGDIDFQNTRPIVAWLTPVPGGVGPMTVATLLKNTWLAATMHGQ